MTIEEIKEKVENILVEEFEIEQDKLQPIGRGLVTG